MPGPRTRPFSSDRFERVLATVERAAGCPYQTWCEPAARASQQALGVDWNDVFYEALVQAAKAAGAPFEFDVETRQWLYKGKIAGRKRPDDYAQYHQSGAEPDDDLEE